MNMTINGFLPVYLCGVFGAFMYELLKWYRIREKEDLPKYIKSIVYWIITILFILAGGLLATMYGIVNVNALLAVNIGISAPLIIENLYRTIPESKSEYDATIVANKESVDDFEKYLKYTSTPTVREFLLY